MDLHAAVQVKSIVALSPADLVNAQVDNRSIHLIINSSSHHRSDDRERIASASQAHRDRFSSRSSLK